MSAFTLLTLNIHQGFSAYARKSILDGLRLAVRTTGADVLCLQEVRGTRPASLLHPQATPAPDYEVIADSLWPQFAYGRNAVFPEGPMGNAVLSKFPIVHVHNHDVSIARSEKRGILSCELQVPGCAGSMHVACVHLGLLESHRRRQLEALCQLSDTGVLPRDAPLIVAGDFNDWRRQADGILARCGLREAFIHATGRHARTFPARFPFFPLDRIYTRNLRLDRVEVLHGRPWSHLSDHVPLLIHASA